MQSIKILVGIAVVGTIVLLGFFVFFQKEEVSPPTDSVSENLPQAESMGQRSVENKGVLLVETTGSLQTTGFQYLFQPITRPLEPAVSYLTGGFFNENSNNSEDIKSVSAEHVSTSKPVLSEEQIFDILWPKSYRDALVMLQDLMVKDDFISESAKVSHMTSDDHIYAVLLKIAAYALKQGWVGSADFDQLRAGIQELERTISAERANLRTTGKISNGVLLPGGQNINKTPLTAQSFFSMIVDGLKYSLTVNMANAQIPGVPGWHTTPDCYKDLAPLNPVPGVNVWAFCCNCGLFCVGYYCEWFDDCGPFSVECNVPLGCLNLMCGPWILGVPSGPVWPNTIWDPFPGTGICGCG